MKGVFQAVKACRVEGPDRVDGNLPKTGLWLWPPGYPLPGPRCFHERVFRLRTYSLLLTQVLNEQEAFVRILSQPRIENL